MMTEWKSCSACKHCCICTKNSYHYCKKKKTRLTFLERTWEGCFSDYEFTCFEEGECEIRHR